MIAYDRLLSTDNPKASKAADYGWLNGIHYMAPGKLSGFNLCAARDDMTGDGFVL